MVNFQKTTNIATASNSNETFKKKATFKYNYSSSQTLELHPLLRAAEGHSILQPYQLFPSLVRPLGFFLVKCKADAQSLPFTATVCNEENTGHKSVLYRWVFIGGYRLDKECLSLAWLSELRAAGSMSNKLEGLRKILEVCSTKIEQLCWSLLVMHLGFLQDLNCFFVLGWLFRFL